MRNTIYLLEVYMGIRNRDYDTPKWFDTAKSNFQKI